MAAWQVDFYLVSRRDIPTAVTALTPGELDSTNWWTAVPFPADYQQRLDNVAPRAPSVSPKLQTWGRDDGNRIDVASDGERVHSVLIRVDVRRLDSKFGAALLEFVRKLGAVLVRRDGLIVEPTIAAYAGALRNSDAWRFVSGPSASLGSNAAPEDDDE